MPSPMLRLRADATGHATLHDGKQFVREWANPLDALAWMAGSLPAGRWVGFLSYDLGRWFERIPVLSSDPLGLPLLDFLHGPTLPPPAAQPVSQGPAGVGAPPRSTFTPAQYESAVCRALEYIRAGDIFQVNLSQRFCTPLLSTPAAIYQRLLAENPACFGAFLDFGDYQLLSNSPELFLRCDEPAGGARRILTRPIKGTRPRRPGQYEQLLNSAKDAAELNMIIDLERNDLGRICQIGSVRVTQARSIESHPTVYHGVASVEGALRADVGFVDILRATFPGGSITGAPKIRAMEIIEELEPVRRGPYCGAIGYLDASGHFQFNVAIRTLIAQAGQAYLSVGGGIVADSVPGDEYDETLVKAQAFFQAMGISTGPRMGQSPGR